MASLEGKVAIVTGAARGIGLEIAREFVEKKAKVLLTDIVEDGRTRASDLGDGAAFHVHDVTRPEQWADVVEDAISRFGPVTVLVNNAGISDFTATEECTEAHYRRIIEVDQVSVFLGMKAVIATMREAGGGSIINTSSTAGFVGAAGSISYVAAKFAVTGMTKAAALDLGKFGIRVNSVHPGIVETSMMAAAIERGMDPSAALHHLPINRPAVPREIAEMYAFLASDAAAFCTGASFVVDGGLTAS
jgi:3alpha(or 20beta)-hydroxysteroid dehydrogenase